MIQQTKGFFSEFRNFAIKGNMLDLAIAVVVGNAFSAVVNSLVADIITPFIGLLTNNVDFKTLAVAPRPDLIIKYGSFLQTIINFFIISLSIFIVLKIMSAARKKIFREGEDAVPQHEKPAQERLLEEIRDLLKEKK